MSEIVAQAEKSRFWGLIPARAGKVAEHGASFAEHRNHPRVCGEGANRVSARNFDTVNNGQMEAVVFGLDVTVSLFAIWRIPP